LKVMAAAMSGDLLDPYEGRANVVGKRVGKERENANTACR